MSYIADNPSTYRRQSVHIYLLYALQGLGSQRPKNLLKIFKNKKRENLKKPVDNSIFSHLKNSFF